METICGHLNWINSQLLNFLEKMENKLLLQKLPSDTLTMLQIKNMIRKMIAEGNKVFKGFNVTYIKTLWDGLLSASVDTVEKNTIQFIFQF